jgi:hypothetical protein
MTVRAILRIFVSAAILIGAGGGAAWAQNCTAADFGSVVDQTARALRDLNGSGSKRFQAKVAALREKHKLSQAEIDARTTDLHDEKIDEFNREIESLVAQMDVLSQTPNSKITCEKLDELKRVRDRLLTVMGQKSGYMLAKVEDELENGAKGGQRVAAVTPPAQPQPEPAAPATPQDAKPEPAPQGRLLFSPDAKPLPLPAPITSSTPPDSKPQAAPESKPRAAEVNPLPGPEEKPQPPANIKPAPQRTAAVDTAPLPDLPERSPGAAPRAPRNQQTTSADRGAPPPPFNDDERPTALSPPPAGGGYAPPRDGQGLPPPVSAEEGYSISEIREAGRGVFGTITAEFGGAINYAFQNFGQPNAYITGVEGGAAFLAGLRYGKGTIHRKTGPSAPIYWQGPSAGLDFGAEGSRSLFLVYNLDDPYAIYGRFSGIGGQAYVAGGVGLNVLGKGGVIMVPIRSGLGLRLGANLAYVKFTERQTWNPF